MKKEYVFLELEIVLFNYGDVLTADNSREDLGEDQMPIIPLFT